MGQKILFLLFVIVSSLAFGPKASALAQQNLSTPDQLDGLLAPVALYPDSLLAQILMASTYPGDVVDAYDWRQGVDVNNPSVQNDLARRPWDPSVKTLTSFPEVLKMLNDNIQWTEEVGRAFLAQQADVMDSVQRLRARALQAGTLRSNAQQTVSMQNGIIVIEPAEPNVVYVPGYDPNAAYGAWPYGNYPPYAFPDTGIGYGTAFVVASPYWGWSRWNWRRHRIDIDKRRHRRFDHEGPHETSVWHHNAERRSHEGRPPQTQPSAPVQGAPPPTSMPAPNAPPSSGAPPPRMPPNEGRTAPPSPTLEHEPRLRIDQRAREPVGGTPIQPPLRIDQPANEPMRGIPMTRPHQRIDQPVGQPAIQPPLRIPQPANEPMRGIPMTRQPARLREVPLPQSDGQHAPRQRHQERQGGPEHPEGGGPSGGAPPQGMPQGGEGGHERERP